MEIKRKIIRNDAQTLILIIPPNKTWSLYKGQFGAPRNRITNVMTDCSAYVQHQAQTAYDSENGIKNLLRDVKCKRGENSSEPLTPIIENYSFTGKT